MSTPRAAAVTGAPAGAGGGRRIESLLKESARYRALSVLFGPPAPRMADELRGLAGCAGSGASDALAELAGSIPADLEEEHNHILGPGGPCSAGESDYEAACLAGKGPLIADVAAFYRAFAFERPAWRHLSPDHVAVELSFASFILFKQAYAASTGRPGAAEVCRDALEKFRADHLGRILPLFLDRLESTAGAGFYARAARAAREILPEAARAAPSSGA